MVVFGVIAAAMIIAALAFVLPPLLRKRVDDKVVAHKELMVTVYQDQLRELENDLKNGIISDDQYQQAKADIEHNLLADVELAEARAAAAVKNKTSRGTAVVIAIFLPVMAVGLYMNWGAGSAGLDPESATPQVNAEQHQQQDIEQLLQQLRARLETQPDDLEGWYMLGRTYQFLRRFDEAVAAFDKALQLGGDRSADVLSSYADALAMANGRYLTPEAIALLERALKADPFHPKSLWLAGTAAYQEQEYTTALQYWERLLTILPPGSEDARQILANIDQTRSLAGLPPRAEASPVTPPAPESAQPVVLTGRVMLDPALRERVNPEDTVFVFARAAQGPRMPLAIVRRQAKDLPFEFRLDDSMAMNPQMPLSRFAHVVVGARISKTGDAMPQPGDLEGYSGMINLADAQPIQLVIDTEIP